MSKARIFNITNSYKLYVANSLEEYRCETFFTKEPETVEWIKSFFRDGDVFYDVGANIGIYSLYAALLYPKSFVYSFEPYYKNYLRLLDNIGLNNQTKNIVPLYMALSNSTGIEDLYVKDQRISSSGHQIGQNIDEHGERFDVLERYPILVYSLDHLISDFKLPVPNHIKIDVDGAEEEIVLGMKKILSQPLLTSVLIEVNIGATQEPELLDLFEQYGFSTDNMFNDLPNHSRHRRKGTRSESAENIIFIRS